MTPKEKANDLLDKFLFSSLVDFPASHNDAKEYVLILIEEILTYDLRAKCESQFVIERRLEEYWKEVKQELLKL